jgi:hypothetical protein
MRSASVTSSQVVASGGVVSASSTLTTITASASTHTKGSYTVVVASASIGASAIIVHIRGGSVARYLFDVAVGASGSEQIIVNNLHVGSFSGGGRSCASFRIPVQIPSGTQISVRCQSSTASATAVCGVTLISNSQFIPGNVVTYNASTATSDAGTIDAGATSNTKGAYTQLTSSTTSPIRRLLIATTNPNSGLTSVRYVFDLAIGSSGSEQIILPDVYVSNSIGNAYMVPQVVEIDVNIPAGTRLAARTQCSTNSASNRLLGLILYGIG